jgi:glycosyltransferase involved in cell wall biosynthesis
MNKLNILYYDSCPGFGGPPRSLSNLIIGMDRKKYYPIIATHDWDDETINEFNGVKFIKVKSYKKLKNLQGIKFLFFPFRMLEIALKIIEYKGIIKRNKISLVHTNNAIVSAYPFYIACKLSGIPCISHIRQTKKLITIEKIFINLADKVIAVNKYAYEMYSKDIPRAKISLVHNCVNPHDFSESLSGNFKKEINSENESIVGYVSRIVEGKGQKEFILAAKEVLKLKSNVKFIIVGDERGGTGDYYRMVKELVKKENLTEKIIFTGWRKDISNVVSAFDISVFGSTLSEGLANVVIEAMALKKPVIATNIASPADSVVNDITGFLVPLGDIKAMADKINYLLDNPEIARKMGEEGRKRVEEFFDIKKTQERIFKIYEDVLKEHSLSR